MNEPDNNLKLIADDKEKMKNVMKNKIQCMPDDEYLYDLAELFRIFGDSTRIKILFALLDDEMNVSEMADILKLSQSSISHQLRILKDAKLVKFRRDGKSMYYSLDDDHVRTMLSMGMEHVEE